MPERPKGSVSSSDEQWSLVNFEPDSNPVEAHVWRVAVFKNGRGELRRGLKCDWCLKVEIPRAGAWNGHGERVEKAKP